LINLLESLYRRKNVHRRKYGMLKNGHRDI
jgi:hypothetical protein